MSKTKQSKIWKNFIKQTGFYWNNLESDPNNRMAFAAAVEISPTTPALISPAAKAKSNPEEGGPKMPAQNLVSAILPAETKTEILQKLSEVKTKLDFLLTLQPDEVRGLFKAANGFAPLIEKAYHAVNDHPEIMPTIFNKDEFIKDYQLSKDLTPIVNQIKEITESLEKTLMAINSDALNGTMEIYAAVKQNRDKVPGLNVVAEEMAAFFPRTVKKAATPA